MTNDQFTAALLQTKLDPASRATRAAHLCLVEGMTAYKACRELGIDIAAVSRARSRLVRAYRESICPTCGQTLKGE